MAMSFVSLGPREEPSIFTTKNERDVWLCGVSPPSVVGSESSKGVLRVFTYLSCVHQHEAVVFLRWPADRVGHTELF